MKRKFHLSALFFLLLSVISFSQIPRTISIQGVLTDIEGNVLPNGSYNLRLSIYLTSSDSEFVWTESHSGVDVSDGVFSVLLGSVTGLSLPFNQPYFLGIRVGDDPELLPRIPFSASPYSLFALDIADSTITSGNIVDNGVTIGKIEPDIISSLNNIRNDGGNIDLVAGPSMTITNNDSTNEITFSVIGGNGAIGQIDGGEGIEVVNPNGPAVEISIGPKSIGTSELEANVAFGPGGSVEVQNNASQPVAQVTADSSGNGSVMIRTADGNNGIGLRVNENGGYLFVNDNSGNERARIFTDDQGNGYITTVNNSGIDASRIAATTQGNGFVIVNDAQGALSAGVTSNSFGGYIFVMNTSGNERARMHTVPSDEGQVAVDNAIGEEVAEMSSVQGIGYIAAYNIAGSLTSLITSVSTGGSLTLYDNAGNDKGAMFVNSEGGGSLFLTNANGDPTIILNGNTGNITSTARLVSRSAMIDESTGIYHTALEGPEAGTYHRGTAALINGEAVISLPDHFALIASREGMTVQLTPHSAESEGLAVISKSPEEIRIKELRKGKGNYEFDFIVHAVHKKYTDFKVIQDLNRVYNVDSSPEYVDKTSAKQLELEKIREHIMNRKVIMQERN